MTPIKTLKNLIEFAAVEWGIVRVDGVTDEGPYCLNHLQRNRIRR